MSALPEPKIECEIYPCPGLDLPVTSHLAGALYFSPLPITTEFVIGNKIALRLTSFM
jgi:hypothetical protein